MMHLILSASLLFLFGCMSPRGVNETVALPVMTSEPADPQASSRAFNDYMQRAPIAAISGTLYLDGDLPTPLVRVQIALLHKDTNWNEITRITTEVGGVFSFTRSLLPGDYELRVVDQRFSGYLPVTLVSGPKHDLVMMAKRNIK